MNARIAAALLAVTATPALAQPGPVGAVNAPRPTVLNLSAYGEARATPDMARITLGVTSQAVGAAEAARLNAQQMSEVVAALRRQGLADRDIQTTGLSLNAQYVYAQNQPPKLTGYQASNQVNIAVQDLAKLGPVIDAVTAAGANQVNGVSFGLKSPQAAEDEARRQAVKALTAKAELYAQAVGYHIVRLISLSEGGGDVVPIQPRPFTARAATAEAPTPVEPGELNVRIDISGVYELAK
jgi:uncharacterized protein YggE